MVCWDKFRNRRIMPNKTSCKCNYNICVECFHKDFQERKNMYSITNRSNDTGDVEKCQGNGLDDVLAFCDARSGGGSEFYAGRPCPFCNVLQLWNIQETPQILESTGRLTFFSPAFNWNITKEEGAIVHADK